MKKTVNGLIKEKKSKNKIDPKHTKQCILSEEMFLPGTQR